MAICKSILELIFSSVYTIFSIRSLFVYPIINNNTIFRIINNTIVTFVHSSNFEYNKSKATISLCLFQHDSFHFITGIKIGKFLRQRIHCIETKIFPLSNLILESRKQCPSQKNKLDSGIIIATKQRNQRRRKTRKLLHVFLLGWWKGHP